MRLLGLDPGLRITGWGVIDARDTRLSYVASGCVRTDPKLSLSRRLMVLHHGLADVVTRHRPAAAAVEEIFVNRNAASALKLGQARGVVLLAPALAGIEVFEYAANLIKKSVVGTGHADKQQVAMMVHTLLPACRAVEADETDALAVAICLAHHAETERHWASGRSVAS